MRKSLIRIIIFAAAVVALLNFLAKNPAFSNLSDKAAFEMLANQPVSAEKTLREILRKDSFDIGVHYTFINNHFEIPERKKISKHNYEYRDDATIKGFYETLSGSGNRKLADIGFYGRGLLAVHAANYTAAIAAFLQVRDTGLKYLNNSMGNAYQEMDSMRLAEYHFRREIALQGNLSGAFGNLIDLLVSQERFGEVELYHNDPETRKFFPNHVERTIYLRSGKVLKYAGTLVDRVLAGINLYGTIAAFLILCTWVIYLRKLDIYEAESWVHITVTVVLGMCFSFLTYPLSDFDHLYFGFDLNGELLNDFFYSVIGIGAVEEFVKIIPLLLMLRFTKAINEPFDYIKYASLSALGFAFIENLIYFNGQNLHIIHGRAFTAVVSHMFDSSIIAYGLLLNKYRRRYNPVLNFIVFFALAALSHGFYDFWLVNKPASTFSIITILYLFASMLMWNSFKNNALNHSTCFDKDKLLDTEKLQDFLICSLAGILIFEYSVLAIRFGPGVANAGLWTSVRSGSYLILMLAVNLTRFNIRQGHWAPIKYWEFNKKTSDSFLEKRIRLWAVTKNEASKKFLPNHGYVSRRVTVAGEPEWYIVKLENPVASSQYSGDTVLIRSKDKEPLLTEESEGQVAFFLFPREVDHSKNTYERKEIKFCGWAGIK